MGQMADETGLNKVAANFVPLTPLSHLQRARDVFAHREALVYGNRRYSYAQFHARCSQLASALVNHDIKPGDVVSVICPNIPAIVEAHFGVPAAGAVLNAINTRLDVDTIAYILGHGGARLVLVDSQFVAVLEAAIERLDGDAPIIVEIPDPVADVPASGKHLEYEDFIAQGDPDFNWIMPQDEWDSLALNYTSGTTGRPKGVVYHHRGAYLMTTGTAIAWQMPLFARYLTIVPLFHCNGWNHSWMMPMLGGTIICCRNIAAAPIFDAIADEKAAYFGGAPIVLNTLINAKPDERRDFDHIVQVYTAGAPPAAATLLAIEKIGFEVTQVYGLTETFGHVSECLWDDAQWGTLKDQDRAAIKARTGVLMPMMEEITVVDQQTRVPVPRDGQTLGEIVIRGNSVMKGYYKSPETTAQAFEGGYFRSGDIAFMHPDGYVKITDRLKDVIISGGENVSSVEVEGALMNHRAVSLCAVVARPDQKWGETPCAFVELKPGCTATEAELIAFCRARLAGFKTPKTVIFQELPKTSTGKIQKFVLRNQASELP
ncbi:MAG: AMP-binding protein [Alphaproteobacteria bacterium]|nr:AMP-binding protein [Alphaproteobacteria bacterium]